MKIPLHFNGQKYFDTMLLLDILLTMTNADENYGKPFETSTNVPGRPEGSYLKFYKCLNYIFNNNTFSPI